MGGGSEAGGPSVVHAGRGLRRQSQSVRWDDGRVHASQRTRTRAEEEKENVGSAASDSQGLLTVILKMKSILKVSGMMCFFKETPSLYEHELSLLLLLLNKYCIYAF